MADTLLMPKLETLSFYHVLSGLQQYSTMTGVVTLKYEIRTTVCVIVLSARREDSGLLCMWNFVSGRAAQELLVRNLLWELHDLLRIFPSVISYIRMRTYQPGLICLQTIFKPSKQKFTYVICKNLFLLKLFL